MRSLLLFVALASALAACKGSNEVPERFRGRYRLNQLLGSNNLITVAANTIEVAECNVNCGEPLVRLTKVTCTGTGNMEECTFESEHCTGTMSKGLDESLSIDAIAVPGNLEGEALAHRNLTCSNIDGTMGVEP